MGCAMARDAIPKLLRAPARCADQPMPNRGDPDIWLALHFSSSVPCGCPPPAPRFAHRIFRPQGLDTPRFGR